MKSIAETSLGNYMFIGIIKAEDWFDNSQLKPPIYLDDLVVCLWADYHDGVNHHYEGLTTMAICRLYEDAEILYNHKVENYLKHII